MILLIIFLNLLFYNYFLLLNLNWGLGIGDWANPQSPIPNPQSPIPNNIFEIKSKKQIY